MINHLDLFSGIGGFSYAAELAGVKIGNRAFSEIDKSASLVYKKHFPISAELGDIVKIDGKKLKHQYNNDWFVTGGFPCFCAGTLILSQRGFVPIETVNVGDKVLTHLGRWRKVTSFMKRYASETVIIRGSGFPDIITTPEHPFYVRERSYSYKHRKRFRSFASPQWGEAKKLKIGDFVGQVLPIGDTISYNNDLLWLIGRYLADGWMVVAKKPRVVICCNKKERFELKKRIEKVVHCCDVEDVTTVKFHITQRWFFDIIQQFGRYAHGKTLPSWCFSLGKEGASDLLNGYLSGDGCEYEWGYRATTVSRQLCISMALLAQRAYGVVCHVHEVEVPKTAIIDGRIVNQRKQYQLMIRFPKRQTVNFVEENYGWKQIRSVRRGGGATVYNISVEEDESYIADGCIVHNCQDISSAGTRTGITGSSRSSLWWEMHRVIGELQPKVILIENVPALASQGLDRVLFSLAQLGYDAEWEVISASEIGAPHMRKRIWIVAYPQLHGSSAGKDTQYSQAVGSDVADLHEYNPKIEGNNPWAGWQTVAATGTLLSKPGLYRVDDGVPGGLDETLARIKMCGNSIVPQVAAWIMMRLRKCGMLP